MWWVFLGRITYVNMKATLTTTPRVIRLTYDLMRLEEGHHLLIRVPAVELWVTVPDRLDQKYHVRLVVGEHGTRHGTRESLPSKY